MASSLPEELVQEILMRLPPDEPVHLARASLVCKSWRRVLSNQDNSFLRRCRGFHGAPPPLLGYVQNRCYDDDAMQFVPTSIKSPVRTPATVDFSHWIAVDCRHGRVLIHFRDTSKRRLIVWDPITGSHQQLSVPPNASYGCSNYTGAVLCAKDGCDHLDCQDGPFRVVFVQINLDRPIFECASNYSSLTGAWSAPAPSHSYHKSTYDSYTRGNRKHSVVIRDVIYFAFQGSILKYDLSTHWLSEINMPRTGYSPFVIKAEDGGLGIAALSDNSIHIWSRQDVTTNGIGEWVEHRAIELDQTLLPRPMPYKSYQVVGFAEGTNTIFINISTGIFTLDIKSKKVRKVGERENGRSDHILPYLRFYTPRTSGASGGAGGARAPSTAAMSMAPSLSPSKKFHSWKLCLNKLKLCVGGAEISPI